MKYQTTSNTDLKPRKKYPFRGIPLYAFFGQVIMTHYCVITVSCVQENKVCANGVSILTGTKKSCDFHAFVAL